jgi:DNA mismatch endonuclease (patch repair protein)
MPVWPGNASLEQTTFGGLSRAELMARVRSRGNRTTEERFASLLRKARIAGWRRHQRLPGNPDFIWRGAKVAVFVDGCFWHGHGCRNTVPKTNARLWRAKVTKTKLRDHKISNRLRAKGWTVVRIWECELRRNPDKYVARVQNQLERSLSHRG